MKKFQDLLNRFNNNNKEQIVIDKSVSNETINKNLTSHLYDDINKKNIFERQFYTMPVTTVPNDQVAFANESMQDTINTVRKYQNLIFSSSLGRCIKRS